MLTCVLFSLVMVSLPLTQLPTPHVRILLTTCKWDKEKLLERYLPPTTHTTHTTHTTGPHTTHTTPTTHTTHTTGPHTPHTPLDHKHCTVEFGSKANLHLPTVG